MPFVKFILSIIALFAIWHFYTEEFGPSPWQLLVYHGERSGNYSALAEFESQRDCKDAAREVGIIAGRTIHFDCNNKCVPDGETFKCKTVVRGVASAQGRVQAKVTQ